MLPMPSYMPRNPRIHRPPRRSFTRFEKFLWPSAGICSAGLLDARIKYQHASLGKARTNFKKDLDQWNSFMELVQRVELETGIPFRVVVIADPHEVKASVIALTYDDMSLESFEKAFNARYDKWVAEGNMKFRFPTLYDGLRFDSLATSQKLQSVLQTEFDTKIFPIHRQEAVAYNSFFSVWLALSLGMSYAIFGKHLRNLIARVDGFFSVIAERIIGEPKKPERPRPGRPRVKGIEFPPTPRAVDNWVPDEPEQVLSWPYASEEQRPLKRRTIRKEANGYELEKQPEKRPEFSYPSALGNFLESAGIQLSNEQTLVAGALVLHMAFQRYGKGGRWGNPLPLQFLDLRSYLKGTVLERQSELEVTGLVDEAIRLLSQSGQLVHVHGSNGGVVFIPAGSAIQGSSLIAGLVYDLKSSAEFHPKNGLSFKDAVMKELARALGLLNE